MTQGPRSGVRSDAQAVRAFNRDYTRLVGVLDEHLLESPYTLTEARVLFELAQRAATEVTQLRRDLRLDAGYLTRILSRFETGGLVRRERSADDARRAIITLLPRGRAAFSSLDRRSTEQVNRLLAPLSEGDRRDLLRAMATVRRLLVGVAATAASLRDPRPGEYGWIVERHGATYADEYGWDRTFEGLVARIVADFVETCDAGRERVWIADVNGEPAGCIFCVGQDEHVAKLRLLFVEPWARGLGLGTRLVDTCLDFAKQAGYAEVALWTNDVLVSARRIYEAKGFRLVAENAHRSFGQQLVGQNWALQLR